MKLYKLTDPDMQTYNGFQWELNVKRTASGASNKPCSDGVLHAYADPRLAIIFNSIHANLKYPRLFEVYTDTYIGTDGLKWWSKSQILVKELELPNITINQKVEFAIRISLVYYKDEGYTKWADDWIKNIDRTEDAAIAAADAAAKAAAAYDNDAYAAAYAANAANIAAYAAANAAKTAAYAAAEDAAAYAAAVDNTVAYATDAAAKAAAAVNATNTIITSKFIQILNDMNVTYE